MLRSGGSRYADPNSHQKNEKYINGLPEYQLEIRQHIQLDKSEVLVKVDSGDPKILQLNFKNFKPGSVVAIR